MKKKILFKQWENTDRSQLITQTVNLGEYKELVVSRIDRLHIHIQLNAKLTT